MENFSYGLLYAVAPDSIAHLHINDDNARNPLDWDEARPQKSAPLLHWFAAKLGLIRE